MEFVLPLIVMIGLDQLTKYLVVKNMLLGSVDVVIRQCLSLNYVQNKGIAFSMLENRPIGVISVTLILLGILIVCYYRFRNRFFRISLLLIFGGAIGNLLDRVFRKGVVDFIQFHVGNHYSPIFNVADFFIIGGSILMLFYLLKNDSIKQV